MLSFIKRKLTVALALICVSGGVLAAGTETYVMPNPPSWGNSGLTITWGTPGNGTPSWSTGWIKDTSTNPKINTKCVKLKSYSNQIDVPGARSCGNLTQFYNAYLPKGVPCMYEENSPLLQCFTPLR